MTLRSLDRRNCTRHGDSLFLGAHCIHCAKEGIPAPKPPPLAEPIAAWMRRCICGIDSVKRGPPKKAQPKKIDHAGRPPSKTLTAAEQRVVAALAEGITNYRQVAERAGINKRSVARCIEAAMQRVGAHTQMELVERHGRGVQT